MLRYEPSFSQVISRGRFTLREKNGQWSLTYPDGSETPAGSDAAAALDLMDELHRHFATSNCRVYFAGEAAELGKMVKIGFSRSPRRRLADMQTGSPCVLAMLAVTDGTEADEVAYHTRFASQRRHGEWFLIDVEILAEIERINAASAFVPAWPPKGQAERVGMAVGL